MYSERIEKKADQLFDNLRGKTASVLETSKTAQEIFAKVTRLVESELASRSRSILSDMLFDLTDDLMETEFFKDTVRQNRFTEINLRQEILNKYKFTVKPLDYQESSRGVDALRVGGTIFTVGGIGAIAYVLISGSGISAFFPAPIAVIISASIGAVLIDYYVIEPKRSKNAMKINIDNYLIQAQKDFLEWFDEIECYYYKRVEDIKQTI